MYLPIRDRYVSGPSESVTDNATLKHGWNKSSTKPGRSKDNQAKLGVRLDSFLYCLHDQLDVD